MDVVDPLPRIHTELFTMIHRECQIAYVSHVYKQALLDAKKQHNGNQSGMSYGCFNISYINFQWTND